MVNGPNRQCTKDDDFFTSHTVEIRTAHGTHPLGGLAITHIRKEVDSWWHFVIARQRGNILVILFRKIGNSLFDPPPLAHGTAQNSC